jgi:hypothetical protein
MILAWGVMRVAHSCAMRLDLSAILNKPVQDPRWVVRGVLPRGSLVILAGEAGAGKTSLCYHLAMCVAAGLPFLNTYPTEPTQVLYIDEENGPKDSERYWSRVWRGLGMPDHARFVDRLVFEHFSLNDSNWAETLKKLALEVRPGVIFIDTATPALHVVEENDNAEASRKIQLLRVVQALADNETTAVILKHEKVRDDVTHRRTIRGAKTWLGQVDIVMYHTLGRGGRDKNGLRNTFLEADKPRAFGLDHKIKLIPSWTQQEEPKGLILNAQRVVGSDDD